MSYLRSQTPQRRRALRRSLFALGVALLPAWAGAQAISDVPLAVKNNVPPNMMFMLDNSGSMSNIVPAAPYNANATYAFTCPASQTLAAGTVDIRIQASGTSSGVPHFVYANNTTYRHVTVGSASTTQQRCFDNGTTYKARLLGNESGGPGGYLWADYTGHYLNWYFGAFDGAVSGWSDRKRVTTGAVETRLQIAKRAAKTVLDGLPLVASGTSNAAVRIGLATYNGSDGGRLLSSLGDMDATKRTTVKTSIDGLSAIGMTPLGETLADIGRYLGTGYTGNITAGSVTGVSLDNFLRQDGRNSCLADAVCTGNDANAAPATGTPGRPIQYWCQRSYVFLMTDGRPTEDRAFSNNAYLRDYDGDCSGVNAANCPAGYDMKNSRSYELPATNPSDYMDDVAKALFDVDLRPNLPAPTGRTKKNNALTYTIGFADLQVQNDPLLRNTAVQGGGRFVTAQDGPSLVAAFNSALTDSFAKDAASSAVAVANAQITLNNVGYASSYNSGSWYGDLEAYALDTTTGLQSGAIAWSARERLNAMPLTDRKIVSFDGTVGRPFTAAYFAGTPASLTAGVIDYVRGDRSLEDVTLRRRQHLLGDIVNAEPVVVTYADGMSVVFQGANDGMLHAFDGRIAGSAATRGQELWAYVPRLVHGALAEYASPSYAHRYFVDGTPAVATITGAGSMTRLLVGALGKGGAGYYALDISSATAATESDVAAKVKWEFTNVNLGYSFGTPLIVKTAAGWRVVVASGYANGNTGQGGLSGDGRGYVWVLDPATGNVLATLTTGIGSPADPSGLAHLAKLANTPADAVVRFVYGGDLKGNVWRFDLDTSAVARVATLTDGSGNFQPITAPLEVGPVTGNSGKFLVYAGTGRYLSDEDIPGSTTTNTWAAQRQTVYAILDDTTVASPLAPDIRGTNGASCPADGGNGDLVCQSATLNASTSTYTATTHAVSLASRRGWYIDLPMAHGRVTGKPALTAGGTLAFTVNVPTNVTCDPGGSSWFFALSGTSGGAVSRVVGGNTYYDAGSFLGFALASRPVIVQTAAGKRALIRMSDKTVENPEVKETAGVAAQWRRVYWRKLN